MTHGAVPHPGCLTIDQPDIAWPVEPSGFWDETPTAQKEWIEYLGDSVAALRKLAHAHHREHDHEHHHHAFPAPVLSPMPTVSAPSP